MHLNYQFSILKGWYDSGAVAEDLLVSNGINEWEWKEVHAVMYDEEKEHAKNVKNVKVIDLMNKLYL